MNFLPCTRFLLTLVSVIVISAISTDQTNITAEVGQETFLPCRSPDNKPVIAVEWIRSDLGSEYVLLYRNRKINLENQHVMFKDRVDLQDRQMKDGNVSLVLKNVTTDDRGAYECRIIQTNSRMEIVFAIYLDVLNPPDQTNITAEVGQETFLPCRSPDNKPAVFVEWRRSDLGSEYVLLYRNDQLDLENQHVMFKDRVDLQDRQMKDGDVSLVLKNVTTDDRGAYECRIIQTDTNSRRKTIIIINLIVTSPGEPDGGNRDGPAGLIGLVVGLVVASVILVVLIIVVVFFVYFIRKKRSCLSPKSSQSSEEPLLAEPPLIDQNRPAEQ
ncbi:V-set domain-containing T-cell activation inhibitor 1-like isoform X2 [Xiphophorus hellerii]|uniref:V-set domain-containing T-cell activation inhibitor 1-like isoform X2 n=1 Tax=Xiphophorus hellerii TaxID=8084 RepID=UPI0013B3EBA6|nr:V-set domain-containing T-cell activation inhibitor 1-like isoform X2 [Xiphophorus hellerii]